MEETRGVRVAGIAVVALDFKDTDWFVSAREEPGLLKVIRSGGGS